MQKILITGGSSGIGFEMSKIWASNGYQLLWVAHDLEELKNAKKKLENQISDAVIHILEKNITHPGAPQEIFDWQKSLGSVDVLINNAGFGTYGYVNEIDMEKELAMIHLNVEGLYRMTRLFLQSMSKLNQGTIINICSNSAFQPVPRMTTYAATKGFVYQFSRGLQSELEIKKSNVKVITVCPAAIKDTPFREKLSSDVKTFDGLATTTAQEVAEDTWRGYQRGKTFIVSGKKMRFLYAIRNFIPYSLHQFLVRQETQEVQ